MSLAVITNELDTSIHCKKNKDTSQIQTVVDNHILDFQKLKKTLNGNNIFKFSFNYLTIQVSLIVIPLMGYFILLTSVQTDFSLFFLTLLLIIYYTQSAFFIHDFAHLQIFKKKSIVFFILKLLSFSQGLSTSWWKKKHTKHHLHTNTYKIENSKLVILDEDIDTLPLIYWGNELFQKDLNKNIILDKLIKFQKFYFWGIAFILRPYWILVGLKEGDNIDRVLIILHHFLLFMLTKYVFASSILFWKSWILANFISSFYLTSVFMFGHTGMKICNQDKENDFILNTIRTSRNIIGDQLTTWLMGGLNYQIEHHLFQTVPRNNLKKSSEFIKKYINGIGEVYYETNVKTAYIEIYKTLNIKLK